jgi:hypothetical protein
MRPTTRVMTKSPRRVAREALAVAREAVPAYSCRTSRRDFTHVRGARISVREPRHPNV